MSRIKIPELDISISPYANRVLNLLMQSLHKRSLEYRTSFQSTALGIEYLKYLHELHDKRVIFMHETRPYVIINPMIISGSSYACREHWNERYE